MLLRHLDNVILFANDTYLENTLYQHEISNRFTWKERALRAIRLHVYARIATQQYNFVCYFGLRLSSAY